MTLLLPPLGQLLHFASPNDDGSARESVSIAAWAVMAPGRIAAEKVGKSPFISEASDTYLCRARTQTPGVADGEGGRMAMTAPK